MADQTKGGPELLAEEIGRRGITQAAAAKELGVNPSTMHHWLKTRVYRPSKSTAEAIERWSEGRVAASSWEPADEPQPAAE